jgi:hypothetical protein
VTDSDSEIEDWPVHFVRVMVDHSSSGVWDIEGVGGSTDCLPVTDALKARIYAWADAYDDFECKQGDDLIVIETHPDFPFDQFDAEGDAITAELRAQLPSWTIVHQKTYRPSPMFK